MRHSSAAPAILRSAHYWLASRHRSQVPAKNYTVLGDAVNLAARLESQSKNYGVTIVIGEETYKEVADFAGIELDLVAVKGKAQAVHIFALLGGADVAATAGLSRPAGTPRPPCWRPIARNAGAGAGADRGVPPARRPARSSLRHLRDAHRPLRDDPAAAELDGVHIAESK